MLRATSALLTATTDRADEQSPLLAAPSWPGSRAPHLPPSNLTSILTITSNVVYVSHRRAARRPPCLHALLARCQPSYGAEKNGLLANLNSVAKLPYECTRRHLNTRTTRRAGTDERQRVGNLVNDVTALPAAPATSTSASLASRLRTRRNTPGSPSTPASRPRLRLCGGSSSTHARAASARRGRAFCHRM